MKPVVVLIRTSSPDAKGSMPEFARIVEVALQNAGNFNVRICDLFPPRARSMWHDHLWRFLNGWRVLSRQHGDLYHLLDGSMAAFMPASLHSRTVVTVHDLIPLLQLEGKLPSAPSMPAAWLIRRGMRNLSSVAGIHAVSTCSLRDVRARASIRNAVVIPHAVRSMEIAASQIPGLPERYILHVGNNADYKNRGGVLDVFEQLADLSDLHLVMVGPSPSQVLKYKASKLERVVFLADVDDHILVELYRRARLLLFPSLYEGFGMPVLEAMSMGCPVVCSDGGSLPEVAGQAALVAKVGDVKTLAGHCRAVLTDAGLRAGLVQQGQEHAAGFTMQRFADSLMAWYLEMERAMGRFK